MHVREPTEPVALRVLRRRPAPDRSPLAVVRITRYAELGQLWGGRARLLFTQQTAVIQKVRSAPE